MKHTLRKGGLIHLRKFLIQVSLRSLCRLALADICAQRILWSFGYDYGVESVIISFKPEIVKGGQKNVLPIPLSATGDHGTTSNHLQTTC